LLLGILVTHASRSKIALFEENVSSILQRRFIKNSAMPLGLAYKRESSITIMANPLLNFDKLLHMVKISHVQMGITY